MNPCDFENYHIPSCSPPGLQVLYLDDTTCSPQELPVNIIHSPLGLLMSHYVIKFYRSWNHPNIRGSRLNKKVLDTKDNNVHKKKNKKKKKKKKKKINK